MSHPAEGLLRRAMDEPAAMGDAERSHVSSCPQCRAELDAAAADRDLAGELLNAVPTRDDATSSGATGRAGASGAPSPATAAASPEVDAAWHRLLDRLNDPREEFDRAPAPAIELPVRRQRLTLRRPLVAVAAAAVVAIGTTAAAAAADWLPIFQPKQVAAVSFDLTDVQVMPNLSSYGALAVPLGIDPQQVNSAAEAAAKTGIDVPEVSALPRGVTGKPSYAVIPKTSAQFTFDAAKARAAAQRTGRSLPAMPDGVDGSTLRVDAGPGVLTVWGASGTDVPELAVIRMAAPVASSQGVSLTTLRDYLLAQPGIPAATAAQLRALPEDGTVLPVPVPSRYATSEATTVDGVPATAVTLKDQSGAGLVWIKDGRLTGVLGLLSLQDVEDVARGLR